jgi:hypothetical protein
MILIYGGVLSHFWVYIRTILIYRDTLRQIATPSRHLEWRKMHIATPSRHLSFALILPQLEHNSVSFQIPTLPTLVRGPCLLFHDPCSMIHASVILGNDRCCCNGDEKGLGAHHNSLRAYRLS